MQSTSGGREAATTRKLARSTRGGARALSAAVSAACLGAMFQEGAAWAPPAAQAAAQRKRATSASCHAQGPTVLTPAGARAPTGPRIELFFKSESELRERLRFLRAEGFAAFSLVNKNENDRMLEWLDISLAEVPDASVCCHYSLRYNKDKAGADATFQRFAAHLNTLRQRGVGQRAEVLLISGSGPKIPLDAVACLDKLASQREGESGDSLAGCSKIGVAFNPFFENHHEMETERSRLKKKLASRQVSSIWLQFGSNTHLLRRSLEWLTQELELKGPSSETLRIVGSLFLPTKQLIAQQRFRPWKGVFLSEDYLSGPEQAEAISREICRVYEEFGVEILVEAPGIRTPKDLAALRALLPAASVAADDVAAQQVTSEGKKKAKRLRVNPATISSSAGPAVVLFQNHDLRIQDNAAFAAACAHGPVVPVFLWCPHEEGEFGVGRALGVYLEQVLTSLAASLESLGLRFVLRAGTSTPEVLLAICEEVGASAVFFNRDVTPAGLDKAAAIHRHMGARVSCHEFRGASLLYEPEVVAVKSGFHGGHWGTLMPFLRACLATGTPPRPVAAPASVTAPARWPSSASVHELGIAMMPRSRSSGAVIDWGKGIRQRWRAGEAAAIAAADDFVASGMLKYEKDRSRADVETATARVSAHLRLGELSPRYLYHAIHDSGQPAQVYKTFSRRLHWRDLAYFHLSVFPRMRREGIRRHYDQTRWVSPPEEATRRLKAWQRGQTGYPIVDAGMRELYATGWMCQSVRMVVASFLVEYLRVNWVEGEKWFFDTLVDADSAINAMMWQNAGRSGIDQWNFVLSPENASQDITGAYTRRWCPELSRLSNKWLHTPWKAPPHELAAAGVTLGVSYPHRIVADLAAERRLGVQAVLDMRRLNQEFNDPGGYDLISLPGGQTTRVFTKQEFRLDAAGNVKPPPQYSASGSDQARGRAGRGRGGRQRRGGGAGGRGGSRSMTFTEQRTIKSYFARTTLDTGKAIDA